MNRLVLVAWIVGAAVTSAPVAGSLPQPRAEEAFQRFLDAPDRRAAEAAAEALSRAGIDMAQALKRLRTGRPYHPVDRRSDRLSLATSDGTTIDTEIEVPGSYSPDRRWPVRVQLHGGVSRPADATPSRPLVPNRLPGEEAIYVQPRGHARAEWWHLNQFEHMEALLDQVKRRYNVDENLVYLTGVSDGATGAYFYAMKLPTPFSAFLPLNGNMRVLAAPSTRANGQLYAGNLRNKPLFVVNGGRDPLYPLTAVTPHIEMIQRAGTLVEFRPQPEAGHDTNWWPQERDAFARFVAAHPRDPHPDRLSWETERTDRYNRIHWLVITQLGKRARDDASLDDVNRFGVPGGEQRMFARLWPSGRADVRRTGNDFEVRSRGVAAFTLLLSPDVVDFSSPVTVRVNGQVVFNAPVQQDLRTLLEWHARDLDRTMLYTAALAIRVP